LHCLGRHQTGLKAHIPELDVRTAGMNGLDATRQIKERLPNARFFATEQEALKWLKEGVENG
jgi:CheY-like chemotaxis protein